MRIAKVMLVAMLAPLAVGAQVKPAAKAIATLAGGQGNDDALHAAIAKAHDSFRPVAQPCMTASMGAMEVTGAKKP